MTPNKKTLLISVTFGIISLVLITLVIYPLFKGIEKDSEELITIKRNLVFSQDKTGNISQIRKIYEEIEPDSQKIDNFFVDPGVPIDLIKFLEKIANDSKTLISITSIVNKTDENNPWNYMEFQTNLVGSFPNFLRFLRAGGEDAKKKKEREG